MQIRVAAEWRDMFSPRRVPGGERAVWMEVERGRSKGWAMEMWPTMPFSKKVQGRTWV